MFTGAFPFCWKDDEPDLQVHCPITFHARIQKVLSEGVQLWQVFLWGEGGSKCPYKQAIIGPPARRILNGVLLADRWWPNIECWLGSFGIFIGSGPILLENPVFFVIFRGGGGGGGPDPLSPLWIRSCIASTCIHQRPSGISVRPSIYIYQNAVWVSVDSLY